MTDADLEVIAKGFAPVIRELVAQEVAALTARMLAVELRSAVPGRDGRDGLPGATGERGPAGEKGADGLNGADGKDGAPGTNGQDGAPGLNGKDGANGLDGKDGAVGPQGQKGLDGQDGRDGVNLEASDFASMRFDPDTRTLSLTFTRGEKSVTQSCSADGVMLYRDTYAEGKTYAHGDTVTWGGSLWYAKESVSDKPGINTDESRKWVLVAKRGSEGRRGDKGDPGPTGPRGPQGDRGPERW